MISIEEIKAAVQDEVVKLIHKTEARGCRVINTATQTVNNGLTALTFNTVISDSDTCWAVGSPTRLVAPLDGYYCAGGAFGLAAAQVSANARLSLFVRVNGVTYVGGRDLHALSGVDAQVSGETGHFWLSAGDYVELVAYNSLAAKTASAASVANQALCNGWLMRVS